MCYNTCFKVYGETVGSIASLQGNDDSRFFSDQHVLKDVRLRDFLYFAKQGKDPFVFLHGTFRCPTELPYRDNIGIRKTWPVVKQGVLCGG